MAMTIHVDIVSAEAEIFSGTAEMVFAPAELGEVGIAPRHAPFLSRLVPGEVRVKVSADEQLPFYVSGGIIEVQPHVVTILADTAIRAKDIDEAAALEAKRRAEEALRDRSGKIDYARAQAELVEAVRQLQVLERFKKHKGRLEK
ncbi:MAG TPA: F0F1 ATP synthase subunit epsilon [Methylothermaceae bacterium]|nr:F0F1 ATP synthase subunit epsilon [Methylothermaceae bacterium]